MSTAPVRNYSWPPFEAGNTAAMKHGARSERSIAPLATEYLEQILAAAPWVRPPVFRSTVEALARAEAQAELLHRWLDEHGLVDADGEPRSVMVALERVEKRADRLRQQLGLSPTSWAALWRSVTDRHDDTHGGAAALRAVGAQIIEAAASEGQEGAENANDTD